MFDSETANFIRLAPSLTNLDISRLPELLTDTYSKIVSIRTRISSGTDINVGIPVNATTYSGAMQPPNRSEATLLVFG